FYLPKLSFMQQAIGPSEYHWQKAFTDRLWGAFAQLEVVVPNDLRDFLHTAAKVGLVLLVVALVVRHRAVRRNAGLAVVLAAAVVSLVLALHLIAYRSMIDFAGDPIITGRYLLPLLPLFGVAVALVAAAMPRRA